MIKGMGIDILEIKRIEKILERKSRFLERLFTQEERLYFESKRYRSETIAGTFAAKEAVSKALGTGIRGFNFCDLEVLRDGRGAPFVVCHGQAEVLRMSLGISKIHISISHSEHYAIAQAIAE